MLPVHVFTTDKGHYVTDPPSRGKTPQDAAKAVSREIRSGDALWSAGSANGHISEYRWRVFTPEHVLRVEADKP